MLWAKTCSLDRQISRLESAERTQAKQILQPGHVYLYHDSLFYKSPDGEVILIKPTSAYPGLPIQSGGNVIYPSSDEVKLIWPVKPDTIDWSGNLIYDKP
jgi:hypothetical protein